MSKLDVEKYEAASAKSLETIATLNEELASLIRMTADMDSTKLSLTESAKCQKASDNVHDALDKIKKYMWNHTEMWKKSITPDRMEEADMTSAKVEGVGTVSLRDEMSVKQLDKAKVAEWLTDIGRDDIISESINASSLKSVVKKRIEAGEEIPDCIEVNPYQNAVIL